MGYTCVPQTRPTKPRPTKPRPSALFSRACARSCRAPNRARAARMRVACLHHCQRCLCSFKTLENLSKHMETCVRHSPMQVTMPKPNSELRFDAWHKTVRHPIAIYADFEALSTSIINGPKDCQTLQTAASFGLYIVSDYELSITNYHSYVGLCRCGQFK